MRARSFHKRVELWQTEESPDGYGGNTSQDEMITVLWANIKTLDNKIYSFLDLGVEDRSNTIVIKLRKRDDITYNAVNQYFVYGGFKYIIQIQPNNIDFDNSYEIVFATREAVEDAGELEPIAEPLVVYTNYINRSVLDDGEETSNTCLYAYVETLF